MLINIRTDGSRLFADQPVIASGSVGTAAVQFTFDPLWAGYEKSALFRIGAKKYTVLLDKYGACIVPQEALQRSGDVYLGVVGVRGGKTLTSTMCRLVVSPGTPKDGEESENYTPGLYEQFAAKFAKFENMTATAVKGMDAGVSVSVGEAAVRLNFTLPKGDKGDKGETGAQGAKGDKGEPGEPGADGYTPVRGVDYWTAADKAEIDAHIGERTRKTVYVLPSGYLWDMETKTQYSITSLISGFSEIEDAEFLLTKCKFVYYDPDAYVLPGYTVLCDLNACYDGGTLYLDGVLNAAGEKILYSGSWYVTSPDFAEETITMTGTNVTGSENGGYYTPSVDSAGNLSWSASKTGMPAAAGANIRGPQGEKGDKGDPASAGNLVQLINVTTSADNEETNFTLPKMINQYSKLYLAVSAESDAGMGFFISDIYIPYRYVCVEVYSNGAIATACYFDDMAYAVKTAVYQLDGMQIETSEIPVKNNYTAATVQIYGVEAAS